MRRILFCTDSLMAGGTEHQLVELVTRIDRERFDPYILCLYSERAGRSLHFQERIQAAGIPLYVLDLTWSAESKLRAVIEIIHAVRRIRPQIVHLINYHSNLLGRLARPFLPLSVSLLGSVYVEYTRKQWLYEDLSSWLCAAVVCNSPHIQHKLSAELIYNGVNLDRFAHNPDVELRSRVAPNAKHVLLMIGRISQQKAPYLLAEALGILKQREQLPEHMCALIVGENQEQAAQNSLETTIKRYGLDTIVKQAPPTLQPEAYYHAADITVLTSLLEGLPNVILKSLAAGVPVIVSEAANAAGVIQHQSNGWIVPTSDVEALVEVLQIVFALSMSERQKMHRACLEAAARFPAAKMVWEYEALYERL